MIKLSLTVCLLATVILVAPALAQDQGEQTLYAYATYFVCSPDGESRADEIISSSFKPHYDAAVEQGDISSWSWMQHYIGGKWRRVLVITAADMDSILDASGALGEIVQDQTPEAGRAAMAACPPCPRPRRRRPRTGVRNRRQRRGGKDPTLSPPDSAA